MYTLFVFFFLIFNVRYLLSSTTEVTNRIIKLFNFVFFGHGIFKIKKPSKIQALGIYPTVFDMLIFRYTGTLTNLTPNTF